MKTILWKVDMQNNFLYEEDKFENALTIPNAVEIISTAKKVTDIAKNYGIQIVSTADWHLEDSKEISKNPDFKETYPPHCMAGTLGAEIIDELKPENPYVIEWTKKYESLNEAKNYEDILIKKDKFDVFAGNPNTENLIKELNPNRVIVYGVATNVCVDQAISGLRKLVDEVYVVKDAIYELPNEMAQKSLEKTLNEWTSTEKPVRFINSHSMVNYLK